MSAETGGYVDLQPHFETVDGVDCLWMQLRHSIVGYGRKGDHVPVPVVEAAGLMEAKLAYMLATGIPDGNPELVEMKKEAPDGEGAEGGAQPGTPARRRAAGSRKNRPAGGPADAEPGEGHLAG